MSATTWTGDLSCQQELRHAGLSYTRTCEKCGLGPCKLHPVQSQGPAESQAVGEDLHHENAALVERLSDEMRAKPVADSPFDPLKGQATADMINAFLQWKLPQSVASDPCVLKQQKGRTGTNLLSMTETMQMIQEVVCPIIAKHLNQ